MSKRFALKHVSPGHESGTLYDCLACEERCFCRSDQGPSCVHCARVRESSVMRFRFECVNLSCAAKQHLPHPDRRH